MYRVLTSVNLALLALLRDHTRLAMTLALWQIYVWNLSRCPYSTVPRPSHEDEGQRRDDRNERPR